jgi:hypothetical protein
MDQESVIKYIVDTLKGVDIITADENYFFCYAPGGGLPPDHKFPFATLMVNDKNDTASNLSHPSVFRLNIGVSKATFQSLFASQDSDYDFTALDKIMPHPIYGKMYWICVLNPSKESFQKLAPMLAEAYEAAAKRYKNPGT